MVHVALDVGSLFGHRTGVGRAVAHTVASLERRPELRLTQYVMSMRADVSPPVKRLPFPAALAHSVWRYAAVPPIDRWVGEPEVVHGTNYVVPPARCARVVSVYDCWFLERTNETRGDLRRVGDILRRSVADGATVVVSSDATNDRVRGLLDTDRVHTIHLGPPDDPVALAPDQPPPGLPDAIRSGEFFLALGTVERRKNYPRLVRAFGKVDAELDDVRLVIAGAPGDDMAATNEEIDRLSPRARSRIDVLGAVDEETKAWLLGSAFALAYPSLDEGFGFPILEAQLAGTPVIASSAGSIPEIAGPHALFSPPDDVDALAAHLHWVATSPEVAQRLSDGGRANVARFSWDATGAALSRLYLDLVGRG
jgi:glycosyltransferase involved in cell wall biosynthesis